MKRILLVSLLMVFSILSAELQISGERGNFRISADLALQQEIVQRGEERYIRLSAAETTLSGAVGEALLPVFTQLLALPSTGNYQIANLQYETEIITLPYKLLAAGETDDFATEYFQKNEAYPNKIAQVNKPAIMRGVRFSQIVINPVHYNPQQNKLELYKNISFDLVLNGADQRNHLASQKNLGVTGFKNIFASEIYGWQPERNLEEVPSLYLFIAPDSVVEELEPLAAWKRELGFATKIAALSETGESNEEIKAYLQNAYDNWEVAPEYVVLVGDESGPIAVPSWFITGYLSPQNVTDHPYALLAGDDYFPDLMIGRLSCRNLSELHTIIQKIITYEKEPITEIDWFTRAIGIAVVNDWQGYYSGRETVMSARDKLLDSSYTVVDTFVTPHQSSANQLQNMINEGATFINYRGFGSPSYWSGTYGNLFYIEDIETLNNGSLLPMVTSIVCGGGNFASNTSPTCFGERWLNAGTPSSPKGAIAFIGPSEHDTKVQFNNTMDLGIYQAVAYEDVFGTAEMMLAGKMALYNSFPNNHEMDGYNDALDSDEFYFHVYNLLGDPGLKIWTVDPKLASLQVEEDFSSGDNFIEVYVEAEACDGFMVSLTSEDELITTARTDESGRAILIFDYLAAGDYKITASKYGYLPEQSILAVDQTQQVQIDNIEPVDFTSGSAQELAISLFNKSANDLDDVELLVTCEDDYISVLNQPESFSIAAGAFSDIVVDILPGNQWKDQQIFNLKLEFNSEDENWEYLHQIKILSPEFTFSGLTVENFDFLLAGAENQFNLQFTNTGSVASTEVILELSDSTDNSEILENETIYLPLSVDEAGSGEENFSAHIPATVISGENLQLRARIFYEGEIVSSSFFPLAVGDISQTSPSFGPDGYYAIESRDVGNFSAPEYNWIEIAPEEGGAGEPMQVVHSTVDGSVGWFELPFEFTYFGESFDQITASTEGYIAMGQDDLVYFRNRTIPGPVGPHSMIAPFWDDLNNGTVYGHYDSRNHMYIVSWYGFVSTYSYSPQEFQVILFDPAFHNTQSENGMILFQYKEINNNDNSDNFATVGIENQTKTEGLLLSYANIEPATMHALADETAILITSGDNYTVGSNDTEIALEKINLHNYPNPFLLNNSARSTTTTISFNLQNFEDQALKLSIYNIKGQKVWQKTVANSTETEHNLVWDGRDMSGQTVTSGVYLYKLQAGEKALASNKMLILK
ncbi:MAG: C25 family cysteine peptidase [Candidatus Cloacimonadales bacterium]